MPGERQYSSRENIGALLLDIPRLLPKLPGRNRWIGICNRQDRLTKSVNGPGVRCAGRWSSELHVCNVYPRVGSFVMRAALRDWPIRFNHGKRPDETPEISFVIPHRGKERVPQLLTVLQTLLSQRNVSVECIVIEQSSRREIGPLPPAVRYIHLPHPQDSIGWHKAWAFNVGVKEAKTEIVVCHDSDLLVPCDYGSEIVRSIKEAGKDFAHLQRFLFCLNRLDTHVVMSSRTISHKIIPERVRQNWQGGTLAIKKDAFIRIGGFDERFVGWGGEDNEFYDRCNDLNGWRYEYLPFIHLWHEPQQDKIKTAHNRNLSFMRDLLREAPSKRITSLKSRQNLSRSVRG